MSRNSLLPGRLVTERLVLAYRAGQTRERHDALIAKIRRNGGASMLQQRSVFKLKAEAQELEAQAGMEVVWPS